MYTEDRSAYRKLFFDVWQKHLRNMPLEPVEAQVLVIILAHPEYHVMLDNPKTFMQQTFSLEENPFFHMSLHIALREQIQLDRPQGIRSIDEQLNKKFSTHEAEHAMTTILARVMFEAQQTGAAPDELIYLQKLREL